MTTLPERLAPRTFAARLFLYIAPAILLMIVLAAVLNVREQTRLLNGWFLAGGGALVTDAARAAELGALAGSDGLLKPVMESLISRSDVAYVIIHAEDDSVLASAGDTGSLPAGALRLDLSGYREAPDQPDVRYRPLGGEGGRYTEFVAPILSVSEAETADALLLGAVAPGSAVEVTIGHVRAGLSRAALTKNLQGMVRSWFAIATGVLLASAVIVYVLVRRLTGPLSALERQAVRIAEGELVTEEPIETRDEIGKLSTAFQDMATQLKKSTVRRDQLLAELNELNATLEDKIDARTEELRERTESLELANRHKSEFMANMSHELRTPLNAIIGYSEMLEEDARAANDEAVAEDLRKIHTSGRHLLGLINEVLDISKIESGQIELFLETFDVRSLVDETVSTVRVLAEQSNSEIIVRIHPDVGAMHSDMTRVRQCLFNLCSNACKFTHNGHVTIDVFLDDAYIEFCVRDTGIGMTEEQLEFVFEAFRQADASTTREYGGSGLGLTITRNFCKLMGGEVHVTSAPGEGSEFCIRLPRHLEPAAADEASNTALGE